MPRSLDESARMLGATGVELAARVHWPLLRRAGLAAGHSPRPKMLWSTNCISAISASATKPSLKSCAERIKLTVKDSNGMKHLAALSEAGLTPIHLLPAFDIASVNEDKSTWQTVDEAKLKTYPPDSDQQSIDVSAITATDPFNWGYDPLHYTTPDGSYATDPNGTPRIVEFREMVQSLYESGLRVVMDVVYNHTNASGQSATSVLDRVVPGYYHRLNGDGNVELPNL